MMRRMLSLGRVRRAVHPLFLKHWLHRRSSLSVRTRVEGFDLDVFPMVFHPRYFGSSAILATLVSSLELKGKSFLDMFMDMKGDAVMPSFGAKALPLLRQLPELQRALGSAESLLRLRGEPVWAISPYRIDVK